MLKKKLSLLSNHTTSMTIYNHSPSDTWTLKTTGIIPEFATWVYIVLVWVWVLKDIPAGYNLRQYQPFHTRTSLVGGLRLNTGYLYFYTRVGPGPVWISGVGRVFYRDYNRRFSREGYLYQRPGLWMLGSEGPPRNRPDNRRGSCSCCCFCLFVCFFRIRVSAFREEGEKRKKKKKKKKNYPSQCGWSQPLMCVFWSERM